MVNAHSHAFQRDLRGAAERPAPEAHAADDFWSWREAMYALASRHDPVTDARGRRARVRGDGGRGLRRGRRVPLRPPPPGRHALRRAERDGDRGRRGGGAPPGLRIVLLPAAYHRAGFGAAADARPAPLLRPGRGDVPRARRRAARVGGRARGRVRRRRRPQRARGPGQPGWRRSPPTPSSHGLVRHVHAHEQPRELDECRAEHGVSPIELLHRTGFLGPRTSVIHAIHVEDRDLAMLADTGTIVVSCPTTEGSLGDGHFPALRHDDAGVRIAIGSDSNVRVDPFEETRELETLARRERRTRHALLAAPRRPLGVGSPRPGGRASASTTPGRSPSTATTRTCAAWPRPTSRSRSRRARRPPSWRDPRAARVPRRGRRTAPGPAPAPGRRRARADARRGRGLRPARRRGGGDPARRAPGGADGDRDRAAAGRRRPRHAPLRARRASTGSRSSTRPG